MSDELVAQAEKNAYGDLFRFDLNWGAPDQAPITLETDDGESLTATNVSSYKGLRVWECPKLPGSALEAKLEQLIAKTTTNRLVIFYEGDKQVWRWPSHTSKGSGVTSRPARHEHRTGAADPNFEAKLDAIRLPDDVVLDINAVLTKVRDAFDVETKNETKRASKLMARMYTAVEKAYPDGFDPKTRDHEISVSLARILFLLFGDDTEMWATDQFQDFIKDDTARDGSDIGARLNSLFEILDTAPGSRGSGDESLTTFPYVNGGIFEERISLPDLDKEFRDAVLDAAAVDWTTISPAIFGSMFQSVRDAQTRRELGEHYTSEANILKTLNPLFLDELRAEFSHTLTLKKGQVQSLNKLWTKLGDIRFMDPACGCGNFIIVAYRELRDLELQILSTLADLQVGVGSETLAADWTSTLKVTLDHFYGIEIDEWPARIAETAMFLIDRQSDLKLKERFGEAPERLPIKKQARIEVANALLTAWTDVCPPSGNVIIAGNPPFIGARMKSDEQAAGLEAAWGLDYNGDLDFVTGWHAKAVTYFGRLNGLWAFVTTNSITQGRAPAALFGPLKRDGWNIKFAHRTFAWTSEATGKAAVHCVIVGFSRSRDRPRLFDYVSLAAQPHEVEARTVNAYLVDAPWVLVEKRSQVLSSELARCDFGSMPNDAGYLIVEADDYAAIAADPVAAGYLRRFQGSEELINGRDRWCLWLVKATQSELSKSEILRSRTSAVRDHRLSSKRIATNKLAATPHLFGERRQPMTEYLCIPSVVSEGRRYMTATRYTSDVIASNLVFTAEDTDGFLFALISSSMFMTWQRTVGGRLKSDLRFSNTIVWNNFPVPALTPAHRSAVIEAGKAVLDARERESQKSLAQQYAPGSLAPGLLAAHDRLDEVVDRAFGARGMCSSEEDRQQILFRRYEELTSGLLAVPEKRSRR